METEQKKTGTGYDWQSYTARYRKEHPEKRKQWELNSARRKLEKAGFTVIPPDEARKQEV